MAGTWDKLIFSWVILEIEDLPWKDKKEHFPHKKSVKGHLWFEQPLWA